MSRHYKPRAFWRLARIWFRHVRITVWLVLLLLLVILLYLHNVGLPGFAQRAVVRELAEQGVKLETTRIHLVWFKSIAADNVRLQPTSEGWVPRIECRRLDLHFDPWALLRFRLVPHALEVDEGQFVLPSAGTTGIDSQLVATNLHALIQFSRGGSWTLDGLKCETGGCRVSVSGSVANASLIQDWRILQRPAPLDPGHAEEICARISEFVDVLDLDTAADLRIKVDVDGALPEQASLSMTLRVRSARSPYGVLEDPELTLSVRPTGDDVSSVIETGVHIARLDSNFGQGQHLRFSSAINFLAESGGVLGGRASLSAQRLDTLWAGAVDLDGTVGWTADGTNLAPTTAEFSLVASSVSASQGLAEAVRVAGTLAPSTGLASRLFPPPGGVLQLLEPFDLSAEIALDRLSTPVAAATNVAFTAVWSSPSVGIEGVSLDWAKGHLRADAAMDTVSGRVTARATSDFDPQRLYAFLPMDAVIWLEQFTWESPPVVNGELGVTLPRRDLYPLLWPGDLRPSLYLNGNFDVGPGTFQTIPLSGASSHLTYSNMTWYLPNLVVKRPDGSVLVKHRNDERAGEFFWSVSGAIDPTPGLVRVPESATNALEVLGTLQFGGPPEVELTAVGLTGDAASVEAWGRLRATNFAFRGCEFDLLETRIGLTNLTLTVAEPTVTAETGMATAHFLAFDFVKGFVAISNAWGRLPPMTIATVIGPDVVAAIEPYRFHAPPEGRVNGVVPLKGVIGADMRFDLKGGPFSWLNFNLHEIGGLVVWRDETVELRNLDADFYDGRARGDAFFDFTGKRDADFRFNVDVDDADIQPLVADGFNSTNRLEGRLSGRLTVTNANTADLSSWFGHGEARLEDGYIWNVPVFGIVSPLLDLFLPGLGSSRAKEAEGTFVITNGVIRTEDLVIHTSNMRLLYFGTVDFEANVDATAEAEVLGDTLIVGEVVSAVLMPLSKAMIIELGGTLNQPEARPLYLVPRILLAPLNPLKLFRDMFGPREEPFKDIQPTDPSENQPVDGEGPAQRDAELESSSDGGRGSASGGVSEAQDGS